MGMTTDRILNELEYMEEMLEKKLESFKKGLELERCSRMNFLCRDAIRNGDFNTAVYLITKGASVRTALIQEDAIAKGDLLWVKNLVSCGADAAVKSGYPIRHAFFCLRSRAVEKAEIFTEIIRYLFDTARSREEMDRAMAGYAQKTKDPLALELTEHLPWRHIVRGSSLKKFRRYYKISVPEITEIYPEFSLSFELATRLVPYALLQAIADHPTTKEHLLTFP